MFVGTKIQCFFLFPLDQVIFQFYFFHRNGNEKHEYICTTYMSQELSYWPQNQRKFVPKVKGVVSIILSSFLIKLGREITIFLENLRLQASTYGSSAVVCN